MTHRRWKPLVALAACGLLMSVSGLSSPPAGADAAKLRASAYGAMASVGLFGGPPTVIGPSPVVNLPETGGNETKSQPEMIAQFGPATIFGGRYVNDYVPSGELTASVEGRTGPDGFGSSSARVRNVGPDILTADEISSTCRATEAGVNGSASIANGEIAISFDRETEEPAEKVPTGGSPAPNTAIEGTLTHIGDNYRIVLNEQKTENGVLTVNGAHMYLLGPNAVGDLIIAQSVCGVTGTVAGTVPATTEAPTTTTTAAPVTEPPPTTLDAEPASDPGGGAGPAIVIGLIVLAIVGTGIFIALRRRGGPPEAPA
ncbi:MAG: hypothetical protein M3179_05145 [Actinomycetota bacterium]|nr:hypothetical protein [Actinomycetota bacterium]